jgi:integrase
MPLKIKPRGKAKTLWIVGSLLGERIRESTRTSDRRTAEALLIKVAKKIQDRAVNGPSSTYTFAEAVEFYCRRMDPKPKQAYYIQRLLEYWGEWRCQDITQDAVIDYEKIRCPNKVTAGTLKRAIYGPMSAILNLAADNNLCPRVKLIKPKVDPKRVLPAPEEHIQALLDCSMPAWLRSVVLILTFHGIRPSDLKRLRWEHVSWSNNIITFIQTKNGNPHSVRMHPEVREAMLAHFTSCGAFEGRSDPVFPKLQVPEPAMNINQYLRTICKNNGLMFYSTHKIGRHAFATRLLNSGARLKDVQEGGGWADIEVLNDRYGHLEKSHVDEIVAAARIKTDTSPDLVSNRQTKSAA